MSHIEEIRSFFTDNPSSMVRKWEKGEFICREGLEMERLFLLTSGRCRIFRNLNNGRTILYRIYVPGSIIGDIELFYGEYASCSVQCITPVKAFSLAIGDVRKNQAKYSTLIFYLGRGLARKLHENSLSEALNTTYHLETRLARYYLTFTGLEKESFSGLSAGSLGQLSEWMGCSYRHLTRTLKILAEKGGIRKDENGSWTISDQCILNEIASPILEEEERVLFEPGES